VATNLNPCKLVTHAEASRLAGGSLAAGRLQTQNGGKTCIYSGSAASVFTVEVAVAKSAQAASAAWDQEQARAQDELKKGAPAGLSITFDTTSLSGLGDKAAAVRASTKIAGQLFNVSGIYVLEGATFVGFQDLALGRSAASQSELKGEAQTVLGRL
jgi:hypothetical protein